MALQLQPITFREAAAFVARYHRHHLPTKFWKTGLAVNDGEKVVGVLVLMRPVSRAYDDGFTLEVARCCTDGTKNAASMLYGAAWRAAKALGYRRLVTYTLAEESGTSLRAAGWRELHTTRAKGWDKANGGGRNRVDTHPVGQKTLWEAIALTGTRDAKEERHA